MERRRNIDADFRSVDADGSGKIDRRELRCALAQRSLPCSEMSLDAFFQRADANGDGLVDQGEFGAFVERQEAKLRKVYDSIDRNHDGRLTSQELRRGARELGFRLSADQIRSVLRRADSNEDGQLSFEEMRSFLLLLPTINPSAVFEALGAELVVDHAVGEATPPIEMASLVGTERAGFLTALASKLYSGSVAGAVSRTLTAPIDRIKMVMQFNAAAASEGMLGAVRRIHAEGGFPAFFRGNSVNVLKIAPETSIKFLAFDTIKAYASHDPANVTATERFVAGGMAGAVAQVAVYPLEIAKTRLAVSAPGTYAGLTDCLRTIARAEGAPALYNGLGTSIVGIIPYAGVDLGVNSILKDAASRYWTNRGEEPGVSIVLACGMASSSTAMLLTYPLNLIRTRLQANGMPGAPTYEGPADCFRQAIRAGGVRGLYQGILPNLLKVLPSTSISYAIYDALSRRK